MEPLLELRGGVGAGHIGEMNITCRRFGTGMFEDEPNRLVGGLETCLLC